MSNYAGEDDVLLQKKAREDSLDFDEWLTKKDDLGDRGVVLAKFRRLLVPTECFVAECRKWTRLRQHADSLKDSVETKLLSPFYFCDCKTKELLKELVVLAQREHRSWPLARILLLGEPGTGKGMLARTFYNLLPRMKNKSRMPFETLNCASAVSTSYGGGHGGLIDFFGADGFGNDVPSGPGVFERATCYLGKGKKGDGTVVAQTKLAESSDEIDYSRAGVVFLDEFAELDPHLQAAILNAIEEGEVYRQGKRSKVRIGCHVVLATNYDPRLLVGDARELRRVDSEKRSRRDLVDRIPDVFLVPDLHDRKNEIPELLRCFVREKLRPPSGGPSPEVEITKSAERVINNAIDGQLITSVRQLQAIANVYFDEPKITDGNLRSLFRKAGILGDDSLTGNRDLSLAEKAENIGLPEPLWKDDLPKDVIRAIDLFYRRKKHAEPVVPFKLKKNMSRRELNVHFLCLSLVDQERDSLCIESDVDIRAQCSRNAYKAFKIRTTERQDDGSTRRLSNDEIKQQVIEVLLNC